jgi:hypothetical protein
MHIMHDGITNHPTAGISAKRFTCLRLLMLKQGAAAWRTAFQ